jgi:alpha-glucosidase
MSATTHNDRRAESLWWQRGVIYQIYPRSFKDSNGDGIGDLPGITSKLDYLQWLGVDALWMSPIYPSPMADFGYDVADYTDIDPIFGTLADFDHLLAQAHARSLKMILDFVPNHTSDQHPWFVESRASPDNPKRDWYIWADPKPDGGPPNNWLSAFGGSAWEWDEATGQYYLHSFLKEQPDLNWRNPAVKAAMFDVARFWLDRGVDGFRIDVIHFLIKDSQLRDNPPARIADIFHGREYDTFEHIYDKNRPEVHGIIRDFRRLLDEYEERMAVGEVYLEDIQDWASYYGKQLDELHLPFNFRLIRTPWKAAAVRRSVDELEAVLPPGAWPNYVLGNHDQHRLVSRIGAAQARVAAMLLLTLRGTPTLYYGDEIGMTDVEIPPEREQDPWGKQVPGLGLGRDPERTPMQWDAGPNAGFSTVEPWLPVAPDYQQINIEHQLVAPTSILSLYRRLLAYREATPALQWGSYQAVDDVPEACYVFVRQADDQRVLVALNFSDQEQRVALPQWGRGKIVLSTHLDRQETVNLSRLVLRGNEGVCCSVVSAE